jgi:phosphoglucomutase
LAARKQSVRAIVQDHWRTYGRDFYTRHDYEEVDPVAAEALMKELRARLASLPGQRLGKFEIASADDFAYHDPVDGSDSKNQGIRILLKDGSRLVYRLSGTGTAGATLRVYLERFEPRPEHHGQETQAALADLIALSTSLPDIPGRLKRDTPSVIT